MIEAPEPDNTKLATRAIAEALAQATPITAGLARLYQFTHPSEFDQQVQQWRGDISKAVNAIFEHLRPRLIISETSLELARVLTVNATNGYGDRIGFEDVVQAMPDHEDQTLQEACHDLQQLGFLSIESAVARPVLSVRLDNSLFWTLDPYFLGTDPTADAIALAHKLLELQSGISARDLETAMGWPRRQFNPAFVKVVEIIPRAYLRQPVQPDYPAISVSSSPEVQACLKRFIISNP